MEGGRFGLEEKGIVHYGLGEVCICMLARTE